MDKFDPCRCYHENNPTLRGAIFMVLLPSIELVIHQMARRYPAAPASVAKRDAEEMGLR